MAQAPGLQVAMPIQPAPNVYVKPTPREKFKLVLFKFGVAEIVLGSLSCVLAIITISISTYGLTAVGQGIWCGAVIITSGILGINSRSNPSVCMYNANMTLSIISAIFMGLLTILSGIAAGSYYTGSAIIHICIAVVGFIGMVVSITHSAYCCAGVCCRGHNSYQGNVVYVPQNQFMQQPQPMVQLPNGQFMPLQSQPMVGSVYPVATPAGYQPIMNQQYPVTSIPGAGLSTSHQPVLNQQLIAQTSTSPGVQPTQITKEQETQMRVAIDNPPGYSLLPDQE